MTELEMGRAAIRFTNAFNGLTSPNCAPTIAIEIIRNRCMIINTRAHLFTVLSSYFYPGGIYYELVS
jgi:hypothetical protein